MIARTKALLRKKTWAAAPQMEARNRQLAVERRLGASNVIKSMSELNELTQRCRDEYDALHLRRVSARASVLQST